MACSLLLAPSYFPNQYWFYELGPYKQALINFFYQNAENVFESVICKICFLILPQWVDIHLCKLFQKFIKSRKIESFEILPQI